MGCPYGCNCPAELLSTSPVPCVCGSPLALLSCSALAMKPTMECDELSGVSGLKNGVTNEVTEELGTVPAPFSFDAAQLHNTTLNTVVRRLKRCRGA